MNIFKRNKTEMTPKKDQPKPADKKSSPKINPEVDPSDTTPLPITGEDELDIIPDLEETLQVPDEEIPPPGEGP